MVLPLLMSIGLPALAGSTALTGTALGGILGGLSAPVLSGIGAGLGSFLQTGDIGDGIKTGLLAGLSGKVVGSLTNNTGLAGIAEKSPSIQSAVETASTPKFLTALAPNASQGITSAVKAASLPGVLPAAFMGQTMTDAQMMQKEYENRSKKDDDIDIPMPNPMVRTQNPDPYASGGGEGLYFQYRRRPRQDGTQPEYPYYYADGGIMSLAEGGKSGKEVPLDKAMEFIGNLSRSMPQVPMDAIVEGARGVLGFAEGGEAEVDEMMEDSGMNEKDVIVEAIKAIKEMSDQPEVALAMFVQKYGEDALRDLVGRVQSGELDDTVARFAEGDKGMVRGPGDGSGVDDMVPATLEGEQDVLLSDGEFVLRKNTTDALEKAYGGGFLDVINRAEEDAPEKLEKMVG